MTLVYIVKLGFNFLTININIQKIDSLVLNICKRVIISFILQTNYIEFDSLKKPFC